MQTKRLDKIIAQFVLTRSAFVHFNLSLSAACDRATQRWVLWNYHATTNHTKIIWKMIYCGDFVQYVTVPNASSHCRDWCSSEKSEMICWNTSIECFLLQIILIPVLINQMLSSAGEDLWSCRFCISQFRQTAIEIKINCKLSIRWSSDSNL